MAILWFSAVMISISLFAALVEFLQDKMASRGMRRNARKFRAQHPERVLRNIPPSAPSSNSSAPDLWSTPDPTPIHTELPENN